MRYLLNADQNVVFTEVMVVIAAVDSDAEARSSVFFVNGPGGYGKTFLCNCIIHSLRADSKIDEAPMAAKEAIHCDDRLLQDVTKNDRTKFGGKVLLLGGVFRQLLPVVSHVPQEFTAVAIIQAVASEDQHASRPRARGVPVVPASHRRLDVSFNLTASRGLRRASRVLGASREYRHLQPCLQA
ncbi:hypothetical protein PR048_026174 [Dryococelus australis]|uniref:ATP-dependent DNA helicase n=1 Tax=Dryococelus australis TaxID=614101 RepID=A0ABQ9GKK8_9NEOP|nr:hypothetical protein PR048_026174 [Dryococelus australis]